MKLSVIIPVYNEEATLREILRRVRATTIEKEIVIVDDCSTDSTREILEDEAKVGDLRVFYQPCNQGKGAAVRVALAQATGDVVIVQDADLEYDPGDYPTLLEPIIKGETKVVYGSRFINKPQAIFFLYLMGNNFLTQIANIIYGARLTDLQTCYKVFTAEVAKKITFRSDGFDFDPEVTARIFKMGYHIKEVPVSYSARSISEGKKNSWRNGLSALLTLVKYRFVD